MPGIPLKDFSGRVLVVGTSGTAADWSIAPSIGCLAAIIF